LKSTVVCPLGGSGNDLYVEHRRLTDRLDGVWIPLAQPHQ